MASSAGSTSIFDRLVSGPLSDILAFLDGADLATARCASKGFRDASYAAVRQLDFDKLCLLAAWDADLQVYLNRNYFAKFCNVRTVKLGGVRPRNPWLEVHLVCEALAQLPSLASITSSVPEACDKQNSLRMVLEQCVGAGAATGLAPRLHELSVLGTAPTEMAPNSLATFSQLTSIQVLGRCAPQSPVWPAIMDLAGRLQRLELHHVHVRDPSAPAHGSSTPAPDIASAACCALSALTQLRSLTLEINARTGDGGANIFDSAIVYPALLAAVTTKNLTELRVSWPSPVAKNAALALPPLTSVLSNNTGLQTMALQNAMLKNDDTADVPGGFKGLGHLLNNCTPSLRHLALNYVELADNDMCALVRHVVYKLETFKCVNLHSNGPPDFVLPPPNDAANGTLLRELHVVNCQERFYQQLLRPDNAAGRLRRLLIRTGYWDSPKIADLYPLLGNCTQLEELRLHVDNWDHTNPVVRSEPDEGYIVMEVISQFKTMPKLRIFEFSHLPALSVERAQEAALACAAVPSIAEVTLSVHQARIHGLMSSWRDLTLANKPILRLYERFDDNFV